VKIKVTIDNKTFEVDVEAVDPESPGIQGRGPMVGPPTVHVPASAPPSPTPEPQAVNEEFVCRSPVSGVVVKVAVQPGQTLQIGDVLVILEAMKMETNITAPVAGKVAEVKVKQGDSVQAGQIVVEFEKS